MGKHFENPDGFLLALYPDLVKLTAEEIVRQIRVSEFGDQDLGSVVLVGTFKSGSQIDRITHHRVIQPVA